MRKELPAVLVTLIAGLALLPGSVRSDEVVDWNNITLDLIRDHSTNPPRATRALAMVHAAVFDAVNGIEQGYTPYLVNRPAPHNASPRAAAMTAAYEVLRKLYPDRAVALSVLYHDALGGVPRGPSRNAGKAYGRKVAHEFLKIREHDGADDEVLYQPSGEFGYWQPTPPAFAPALLPQWPYVAPFCLPTGDAARAPAPPPFDSPEYAAAYNEVREYGDVDSAVRTADQTLIAYFWEDGAGTVTPPGHWQVIAQQLAQGFGLGLLENARLFALLSMVQADGAIAAWDNKYWWDHVRPYTAITAEADEDGNPDTAADPGWRNLIPTPPFPAYTSGHSTFSGGSSKLLELFFGSDEIAFCAVSPDPGRWPDVLPGVVRCWASLSEAAEEAGQSRIYGGIHWQYDNQEGLIGGRAIAEDAFAHFLLPLQ